MKYLTVQLAPMAADLPQTTKTFQPLQARFLTRIVSQPPLDTRPDSWVKPPAGQTNTSLLPTSPEAVDLPRDVFPDHDSHKLRMRKEQQND